MKEAIGLWDAAVQAWTNSRRFKVGSDLIDFPISS